MIQSLVIYNTDEGNKYTWSFITGPSATYFTIFERQFGKVFQMLNAQTF